MSRRNDPVAEIGDEDYLVVRHTHDVALAAQLMRAKLLAEDGCPQWHTPEEQHTCTDACLPAAALGRPAKVHLRIVPCLPHSAGAAAGWAFEYQPADPGPGAFPAVVFNRPGLA